MESQLTNIPAGLLLDESGYALSGLNPPEWVCRFDDHFTGGPIQTLDEPSFGACVNLSRRVADLDVYQQMLRNLLAGDPSPWRCASFATTILVGYFSSAKSLLDAGADGANTIFTLGFSNSRSRDFKHDRFWSALQESDRGAYEVLRPHRDLVDDTVQWRDAAVHRMAPRVRVHMDGPLTKPAEQYTLAEVRLAVPVDPEAEANASLLRRAPQYQEPQDLVDAFSLRFHAFAAALAAALLGRLEATARPMR